VPFRALTYGMSRLLLRRNSIVFGRGAYDAGP
jgi:hypothetical protein